MSALYFIVLLLYITMPKKAYTKDDNLMPDVSLPDDKPSQQKPTNKKLDALPDVREEKSTVKEEDIFEP